MVLVELRPEVGDAERRTRCDDREDAHLLARRPARVAVEGDLEGGIGLLALDPGVADPIEVEPPPPHGLDGTGHVREVLEPAESRAALGGAGEEVVRPVPRLSEERAVRTRLGIDARVLGARDAVHEHAAERVALEAGAVAALVGQAARAERARIVRA